eukprot:1140346-Pyramimonas_sp.AAC.1
MPSRSSCSSAARGARRNTVPRRSMKRACRHGASMFTWDLLLRISSTKYFEIIPPSPPAMKDPW